MRFFFFTVVNYYYLYINSFMTVTDFHQVQSGVAGPLSGQNGLPGPTLVQAQPIISTVRAQSQVNYSE